MRRFEQVLSIFAGGLSLAIAGLTLTTKTHAAQTATPTYHQTAKIALSGEGGWDYLTVDSIAHRLYVTRGTHVMVIDTIKNAVVGDIGNTPGVHGVAIDHKSGRGFTSNGRENTVTVFNLKTLKELARIPVGKNPDAILYDAASNQVFTFNGTSSDVTVIDAATNKVVSTIPVGGKPEFCTTNEKGMVYCNVEDKNELVAIDARTRTVKHHWPLAPGEEPTGLAIDNTHHRLFAVCGNQKMEVVDAENGKVIASPEIGNGPDATVFDPGKELAISSNGRDGTLTLVHESDKNTFKVVGTIPTQVGARTMALDPKTHRIYLITATFKKAEGDNAGGQPKRPTMEPGTAVILVFEP